MNLIAIAIACVVLVVGAYVGKKDLSKFAQNSNTQVEEENVLSIEDEQDIRNNQGDASVSVDINNSIGNENPTPHVTSSPMPTSSTTLSGELDGYRYANSEVLSETARELHLRSSADVDTVTNWYKEKVRSEGMNIKTFVTTKANEKVVNKLAGENVNKEISIEIRKEPNDNFCSMDVKVTSKS